MSRQTEALGKAIIALLPNLRRFAFALTGQRQDADDLLQSTVERLLDRGVPADADIARWSFRVCKNIWIDEIRARNVRRTAPEAHVGDESASEDGERIVTDRVMLAEVNRAMATLPDEQRAALSLVALEGLSYAETAEALGVPIGTVMSRVSRARRALTRALAPKTPTETTHKKSSTAKR
ncbi:MAG: RNA polymerase sigma factor [Caulobacterales bacterium]|nr:RNA polymerase sigma factor [Caulobacterales bacterium]